LVQGFARTFDVRAVHVVPYDPIDSVGTVLGKCGELMQLRIRPIVNWERFNSRLDGLGDLVEERFETVWTPGRTAGSDPRVSLTPVERKAIEENFFPDPGAFVWRHQPWQRLNGGLRSDEAPIAPAT
jgi:hypothetical protein